MARSDDINALLVRALTSPVNVLPAAAMAAVGFAFGLWPLYLAAAGWYALAASQTFRSPDEARKVLEARAGRTIQAPALARLTLNDAGIRDLHSEARVEQGRLSQAISDSPLPLPELREELIGMTEDLDTLCLQADRVSSFVSSVDLEELFRRREVQGRRLLAAGDDRQLVAALERSSKALDDQIEMVRSLGGLRDRFVAEAVGLVSQIGSIRAEVVRIAVSADEGTSERVLEQVGSARDQMRNLSEALTTQEKAAKAALPEG